MEEIKVAEPVKKEITETNLMLAKYENFKVITNEDNAKSFELCKIVKVKYNNLEEARKNLKQPIIEVGKRIDDLFRQPLEVLSRLEKIFKSASYNFTQEQERLRREEQNRIDELARKEAEKLTKRAQKAEEKGQLEKAEELRAKSEEVEAIIPTVQSKVEPVKGASLKTIWRCRVVDYQKVPREYLIVNDKLIQDLARATKGTLKVEGLEFYPEQDYSVRTR